ncbi:MAG: UDP-3-O-(3-hydroxymyristoyl)glucosamine N-acyltransferase [Burkholderiales bacterium]|jgi:UDP-3-O-[3-hydroxymyristoyl] glucosamine N-acyltransferase|nr:UDP-3-O-(3-hydroxymyristoyl)glucosamine N-acyltransferase [Burkholderiales bacterium]
MRNSQPSPLTLGEIVSRLGGELVGDPALQVRQVATLETAAPDTIAFFANERYLAQLRSTQAGAVIVGLPLRGTLDIAHIAAANPYAYFARVSALFNPPDTRAEGRHPAAVIDPRARIGAGVHFGPNAVIEADADVGDGCSIGAGSYVGPGAVIGAQGIIYPNVSIYRGCVIGRRVIIHSGAVIGADGFGIAMDDGRWLKVPQIGVVRIGDDVEIGANTTIDRGAIDDTVIEDGVKLDNQIQVGHNVRIGAHTAIAACVGIAGSSRIGRYCRIGGASGIAGHLSIADNVEISAHTLITKSITEAGTYTGAYPFESNRDWRRNAASLRSLAELASRVRVLEHELQLRKKGKT